MKQANLLTIVGCTLLLIGTAIGAGTLALPLICASAGLLSASLLLIGIWALMTYTALMILEVNLALPAYANHFSSMAYQTLGRSGQLVGWLSCSLLLYALSAAYIAGNASLISNASHLLFHHTLPGWTNALLFTLVFGSVVFWSTRATDILNRGLMSIKGLAVLLMLILLMPHINFTQLAQQHYQHYTLILAAPVFLTAFGFHTVIPSLSNYLGPRVTTLKRIIIYGTIIPLRIYLIWLGCALGVIPLQGPQSFQHIQATHASVGGFIATIGLIVHNHWINATVNVFADVAMTTSFLGVTLGLFDFLADAFKRQNHRPGRLQTALLTYVPPVIFAVFYPNGFIFALGYAAIFVAVLEVILPVLMVRKLRRSNSLTSPYRVKGNLAIHAMVLLCGILLIAAQIYAQFNL